AEAPLAPTPGAPGEPEPVVVDVGTPIVTRNLPVAVLAVIAVILLLQFASSVFIPIVIAILISYSLTPAVSSLQKHRIPSSIGAGVVLALLLTLLGLGAEAAGPGRVHAHGQGERNGGSRARRGEASARTDPPAARPVGRRRRTGPARRDRGGQDGQRGHADDDCDAPARRPRDRSAG